MFTKLIMNNNNLRQFILLLVCIPLLAFARHKYYISFTKIEYASKSQSLQVIMQVFTDDLQNGLDRQFSISSSLDTHTELDNSDAFVELYLSDKFFITVNKKKLPIVYLGKKYEKDETKLFIEIENVPDINAIEIQNKVLMEVFDDQQNIVKLNINGKKKSFILTKKDDKDLLKF